jgi:hypothetical protein
MLTCNLKKKQEKKFVETCSTFQKVKLRKVSLVIRSATRQGQPNS